MSLADLLGKEYTNAVAAAEAALGAHSLEEALAIANEKVEFFPEAVQKKNSEMLSLVGKHLGTAVGIQRRAALVDYIRNVSYSEG